MPVIVCVALVIVATSPHRAEADTPILLVSPPAHIEAATSRALVPWDLQVQSIRERVPSESMPGARDRAKSLAEQHRARAIVWLTNNVDGPALWIYDAEDDRVVVRRLSIGPPFDEASAASVALSVKTLLMHSKAAPDQERFGAPESASGETPLPLPSAAPRWSFAATTRVRHSIADDDSAELRLGLGLSRRWRGIDIGGRLSLGPGRSVDTAALVGHYSDLAMSTHARYSVFFGEWSVSSGLSASLHWTGIEGTLGGSQARASANRLNPSLGAGAILLRRVGGMRLGLSLHSSYFLRRQRYLVAGAPVLDLPSADIEAGAHIALPFR